MQSSLWCITLHCQYINTCKKEKSDRHTRELTFDFLPNRHIKLGILQLLLGRNMQRKPALIQYLSTNDCALFAVFPDGHIPPGLKREGVFVWTAR